MWKFRRVRSQHIRVEVYIKNMTLLNEWTKDRKIDVGNLHVRSKDLPTKWKINDGFGLRRQLLFSKKNVEVETNRSPSYTDVGQARASETAGWLADTQSSNTSTLNIAVVFYTVVYDTCPTILMPWRRPSASDWLIPCVTRCQGKELKYQIKKITYITYER